MPDFWIQLENRPWDTMPNNIDRMSSRTAKQVMGSPQHDPVNVSITSTSTGVTHTRKMYAPLRDDNNNITDALIYRRYKAPVNPDLSDAWTIPDDRKINAWDLNESDPTDSGTMGTIPGPVIECNVGDSVTVHFRNMDLRSGKSAKARAHSMHVHGFVFKVTSDGAYPLTPPDPTQPIPVGERNAWNDIGVTGPNKMGDRVPAHGSFTYSWNTFGWPTTAGIWLYHDHSFCDMDNIDLGAIGIVAIHNPADTDGEVINQDLPNNDPNGYPIFNPFLALEPIGISSSFLSTQIADATKTIETSVLGMNMPAMNPANSKKPKNTIVPGKVAESANHILPVNDNIGLSINKDSNSIIGIFMQRFVKPPTNALYLTLFHELKSAPGMCMNGRTYLGNTPTLVAGTNTKMKFGVVGMGSQFHTFHIHGHRWMMPGPSGTTPGAIQGSTQNHPTSQFEDTRTFGPANSFTFTINGASGSFMRAGGPSPADAKGEWHMHCHVLQHMMQGMMGSLLIVEEGDFAGALSKGTECDDNLSTVPPGTVDIHMNDSPAFVPITQTVAMGTTLRFVNDGTQPHQILWDTPGAGSGPKPGNSVAPMPANWTVVMTTPGSYPYHCGIHGPSMHGTITVTM